MDNNEASKKNKRKILLLIALMMFVLAVGTYAWFTMSQVTDTNTVSGKTSEDNIRLYISSTGGADFNKSDEAAVVRTSKFNPEEDLMMPVSSSDLDTFLYASVSSGSVATGFQEDSDARYYYKGSVYIMAESTTDRSGNILDVYLDNSQGDIVKGLDDDKRILNATRVGLKLEEAPEKILYLTDTHNEDGKPNVTVVDGNPIPDGYVITKSGGKIVAVPDPSIDINSVMIDTTVENPMIPSQKLFSMEFNKIYKLDVYLYLEGCDQDCTDTISLQNIETHIALFGILN